MKRSGRILAWTGGCTITFIVLLFVMLWFAVSTSTGSRMVLTQIERVLDNQLSIRQIRGALTGPLTLQEIEFRSTTVHVSLASLELDWTPRALLSERRVHVKSLVIQGLETVLIESASPENDSADAGLPEAVNLPLPVLIDQLTLDSAKISTGKKPTSELMQFQSAIASGFSWDDAGINIMQISIASTPVDITGSVKVKPAAQWPLAVDARYTLDLQRQQLPQATGTIKLSGSLARISVLQIINSPYSLHIDANVSDPLTAPQWQATIKVKDVTLSAFDRGLPAANLTAMLNAKGDVSHADLNADLQIENSSVQIGGSVRLGAQVNDPPSVDLAIKWQQLIWPITARDNYLIASKSGLVNIRGVMDAYHATAKAQLSVPAYPTGNLEVSGTGTRHSFALEQLLLSTLGGEVRGAAMVDWLSGVTATFDLSGTNIDPAGILKNWPGRLNFQTQGDAAATAQGELTSLSGNLNVDGVLRDQPVQARMVSRFDETGLTVPSLVLRALGTEIHGAGNIGIKSQPVDFKWQMAMGDLGVWMPGLGGEINADGSLAGTLNDPEIRATITASNIALAQIQLEHATLTTQLGVGNSPLSLNANLDGLQLGTTEMGSVEIDLSGTLAKHVLGLRSRSSTGNNRFALTGSLSDVPVQGTSASIEEWSNTSWQFSFETLDINEGDIAIDLIKESQTGFSGKVDSDSIAITDTCFSIADTRQANSREASDPVTLRQQICAQAAGNYAREMNGNITFRNIPLMMLNRLLPESTGLTGNMGGEVSLGWNMVTNTPQANVSVVTSASELRSTNSQGETRTLVQIQPGAFNANWNNDSLSADLELPLSGSAGLKATATLSSAQGGGFTSRSINGSVDTHFDDLDWMADFLQGVTQLSGQLDSNLKIGGTISRPELLGNLSLKEGKAVLPGPGLTLRDVRVDIVGDGNNGLNMTGSIKSGGGMMSLDGKVTNIGKEMAGSMSIAGQKVLLLNSPEAQIYASPTITAKLQASQLQLEGEVSIDTASIQLTSLPQTAASVSRDQIIVKSETSAPETASRFEVTTRLQLLLNDAVSFQGFGLEANFGGDLNLVDLPGKPTTANGDINALKGSYRAYGQNLKIETGKLLFVGGPIDQPGVDIRAVRQVTPDIKVGALARGNLRAPEFSIFSEPGMNQSDQLAYLVLGRPLSTSSAAETSVLSRAALAMGIKGGNYLTEQFGNKLGVDRIGIETPGTNANEQAALVVGKYLSPKLFVSYGIGILDAVSTLKVEYLLSSQWRLTSESSSEQSGVDLNYVLER